MTPREIRAELIRRGIEQQDIAAVCLVDKSAIANTIAGRRRNPRLRLAIALVLNVPVETVWPPNENEVTTPASTGKG